MRPTTPVEAKIIDYLHRAGEGIGTKQAVIEYLAMVEGYTESWVARAFHSLEQDGMLEHIDGGPHRSGVYSIVASDYYNGDDGL